MVEAPSDRTQEAFIALESALPTDRISFEIDLKRLCHPHCPLPFDYLKSRFAYGYLLLCAAIAVVVLGLQFEKAILWWSLGIFTAAYWIGVRPLAENGIRRKILSTVMEEPAKLETVWRYGGLTLVGADGSRAVAPQDDWRSFALRLKD